MVVNFWKMKSTFRSLTDGAIIVVMISIIIVTLLVIIIIINNISDYGIRS